MGLQKLKDFSNQIDTIAVHGGMTPEPLTGAITPPIFMTSTFVQPAPGEPLIYDYSRAGNPTRTAYEEALAAIERGAKHALSFASGLAAEQAILQILEPGDHVVVCDDVYGGTGRLFRRIFAKYKIDFEFCDLTNPNYKEKLTERTRLLWVESPSNPTMKVIDIADVVQTARKHKSQPLVAVDNTFASPVFQSPLALGADLVIHSSTKYIGGHSDMIGGAVMTANDELFEKLKFIQFAAGSVPSPFEAFLMLRSIKTLPLRMRKHNQNAQSIAEFLANHAKIKQVFYPGLPTHPHHGVAKRQMSGFSGMLSINLSGDYGATVRFLKALQVFSLAESLGGVESLVNHPEKMTHASVPEDQRKKLGIGPNLVRLSVGIEDQTDLIADLAQALEVV